MEIGDHPNWIHRLTNIRRDELGMMLRCAGCFFFVLFGYALIKPVRDAMGVQRSMGDLRTLFVMTCLCSLVVSLLFGGMVSRLDRRRCIPIVYRLLMGCLLVFMVLLLALGDRASLYTGYVFYIWLSVVNLFMVSLFWGLMADVWTLGQGKRVFASIGIGGTLGMVLGSSFVWSLAEAVGPVVQMGIAGLMFELAARLVRSIDRRSEKDATHGKELAANRAMPAPIGGHWADGVREIVRSPYLLGIGSYIVLMTISNTLIYFTKSNIVTNASCELETRVSMFGQIELWTQLSTLFVQLFVTTHLIKRLGIGIVLSVLPMVTVVGFVILAWVERQPGIEGWQVFGVLVAFKAVHSATRYAVIRPARETLFSVVPSSEKYKAKPIIDVFFYRGGDVAGSGIERLIVGGAYGLGGLAILAAPLAVLWGGLAAALAIAQQRKAQENLNESTIHNHTGVQI